MNFNKLFSENLRSLRTERKYTQKDIAEKLDISPSTYANWEQGRREPSINDIYNLLIALEIEPNELFDIDTLNANRR